MTASGRQDYQGPVGRWLGLMVVGAVLLGACSAPSRTLPEATMRAELVELTPTARPPTPTSAPAATATASPPRSGVTPLPILPSPTVTSAVRPPVAATPPSAGRRQLSFNGWYQGENPGFYRASLDTTTGEYHVVVLRSDYDVSVYAAGSIGYADMTLEVDAWRVAGPDGGGYGLVLLRQLKGANDATSRRYIFYVTPQGAYRLYYVNGDGSVSDVVPLTASSAIKIGDATNHLSVTYTSGSISISVNGVSLGTVQSTIRGPGEIGVFVSSSTEAKAFEAGFQNLSVTVP